MWSAATPGIPSFGDRTWHSPVQLATLGPLPANAIDGTLQILTATANGALTVSGTAVTVGMRILVTNETPASHDGIYTVTAAGSAGAAWRLTRAADANTPAGLAQGSTVFAIGDTTSERFLVYIQTFDIGTSLANAQAWALWRGPALGVYRFAVQSIPNGVTTPVTFDTYNRGPLAMITVPSATITVPAAWTGVWHLHAMVDWDVGAVGIRDLAITVNGGQIVAQRIPAIGAATTARMEVGIDWFLQGGNTIQVVVFQSQGAALNMAPNLNDFFTMHWVKG